MSAKIVMVGAGGCFTPAVTRGLCETPALAGSTFVLLDVDRARLAAAEARVRRTVAETGARLTVEATLDRRRALAGAHYVVSSCEQRRQEFWLKDLALPARYGVHQVVGENGGPGGQAHAMRNITMFMGICGDLQELCPDAWLMNFTNPVAFLSTYFLQHTRVKALGFCHQVHGSMGVVAEMLGFAPGELLVVSGGVNHFNWLVDIRRRGCRESFLPEFLARVRRSKYWQKNRPRIPAQRFTLEILNAFGAYPIGYDDHIVEYLPFFHPREEWARRGVHPVAASLRAQLRRQRQPTKRARQPAPYPFPKDATHPHYHEKPTEVMTALETSTPLYLDAINIANHGSIPNLPAAAVVDIPAVVAGGGVRGIDVGPLPPFCAELCRRQTTIHELVARATVTGDRQLALQAMALDPYVRSLTQAQRILDAFLREYRAQLPQFSR